MKNARWDQWTDDIRRAMVDAALDLFTQQGFAATTVSQIAERARVSERTFFRYFATKAAPIFERSTSHQQRFVDIIRVEHPVTPTSAGSSPPAREFAKRLAEDAGTVRVLSSIVAESPELQVQALSERSRWEKEIADELILFGYRTERAVRVLVTAVLRALHGGVREWPYEPDAALEDLVAEYLKPLRPALAVVHRATAMEAQHHRKDVGSRPRRDAGHKRTDG
jgi:AcrR family transcriptional regulator